MSADRPDPRTLKASIRQAVRLAAESFGRDGSGRDGLVGFLRAMVEVDPLQFGRLLAQAMTAEEAGRSEHVEADTRPSMSAHEAMNAYCAMLRDPRLLLGVPDVPPQLEHRSTEPSASAEPAQREPLRPRQRRSIPRELHRDSGRDSSRAMSPDTRPAPQPFHRIIDAAGHGNAPPQQRAAAAASIPPDTAAAPLRLSSVNGTRPTPFEPEQPEPVQPMQPPEPQREKCVAELEQEQTAQRAMYRHRLGAADSAHAMRGSSFNLSDLAHPLAPPSPLGFKVARDCLDPFAALRRGGGRV